MKLAEFFQQSKYVGPDATSVAGFVFGGDQLQYFESPHKMVPAAAYVLNEPAYKNKLLFSNLEKKSWIMEYTHGSIRESNNYKNDKKVDIGTRDVTLKQLTGLGGPRLLAYRDAEGPLAGGLYAAASATIGRKTLPDRGTVAVNEKVLCYYMLATYALIAISEECAFEGLGNHVATLMVDDKGKIIAAGINTGWYRHAEVTMLIDFFSRNSAATRFPEKTVVFSSLTPCEQCTKYLEATKPNLCVIYFGQLDTGKSGKKGQRLGPAISAVTKAPAGREKTTVEEPVDPGGTGVATTVTRTSFIKARLDEKLSGCTDPDKGNIADQISDSTEATKLMRTAADALIHKVGKDRSESAEDVVKARVLKYLTYWLGTVSLRS